MGETQCYRKITRHTVYHLRFRKPTITLNGAHGESVHEFKFLYRHCLKKCVEEPVIVKYNAHVNECLA